MTLDPSQSSQSQIVSKLVQLNKLNEDEHKKHAAEISNILLWTATNHPEVLKDENDELKEVSIKRLYFRDSWEFPDELVPTDALTTLLNSRICKDLKAIWGYLDPQILSNFHTPLCTISLAIGKHTNFISLIEELKRRKQNTCEVFRIHLRCGELNLEDLPTVPDINLGLFISDVSDADTAWVVQATSLLRPQCLTPSFIEVPVLCLPCSQLTAVGVECIAKGLFDADIHVEVLEISSPYIDTDGEIPGYGNVSNFVKLIMSKYDLEYLSIVDEKEISFTEIIDDIFGWNPTLGCEELGDYLRRKEDLIIQEFCQKISIPQGSILCPTLYFTNCNDDKIQRVVEEVNWYQ
ncbi:unnamed protein product [Meganyctiphanes norvegica]|uniref:Uncharacterized protein n=1 Tax=Meganyctiphanes norvegica TaxID=48144 RepID=A0AAV2QM41_MEGNR